MNRIVRRDQESTHQAANVLELFYDLVFVFAITQVSHLLLSHLNWTGVVQSVIALMAVWWSWNYTTWFTDEVDPESNWIRIFLLALMLLSLLMAVALPHAFGDRATLFAVAYVAIQVGRHGFLTFVAAGPASIERERAGRILAWFVVAGIFWIGGSFADGWTQIWLWIIAVAIDYGAPLATFWLPGRPRLVGDNWQVAPEHFTERFQLFILLALGESIVVTGSTTSDLDLTTSRVFAFAISFIGSAALWWLYFSSGAKYSYQYLEYSDDPTILARDAYTYLHLVLAGSIILSAVGDEFAIAHPTHHLTHPQLAVVVLGPAIYLLAQVLFAWRMAGIVSWIRVLGIVGCLVVGLIGLSTPAIVVAALLVVVQIAVIVAQEFVPSQRFGPHPAFAAGHHAA
ncbi:MAG TPA: low temperature requirement protein A [Thermomicrobiales bacterium]|nr:low temperature requirement protein A [Thermomicrobiales bacterium]